MSAKTSGYKGDPQDLVPIGAWDDEEITAREIEVLFMLVTKAGDRLVRDWFATLRKKPDEAHLHQDRAMGLICMNMRLARKLIALYDATTEEER